MLLAERIKEEIAEGRLLPGQALPQEELAARFGVSRSPLREALHRLEGEGLIHYHANRGAVVAFMDAHAVHDTFELRRILDSGAIDLVVDRIGDAALIGLRAADAALRKVRDPAAYALPHGEFHLKVYETAKNPLIVDVLASTRLRVARLPQFRKAVERIMKCSKSDHAALLDALEKRDRRAARKVTLEHLNHMESILLELLPEGENW